MTVTYAALALSVLNTVGLLHTRAALAGYLTGVRR